jgi:sterol desaturase/sphingolipid hydroxylase (fatty acid hydroxylase superfamily)
MVEIVHKKEDNMKLKLISWFIFVLLFLFFLIMFYIEVSLYSLLPPEEGGMSFWTELKFVWYRSIWFYAILVSSLFFLYIDVKKGNTDIEKTY